VRSYEDVKLVRKLVKTILSKPDPQGYYVVPIRRDGLKVIEQLVKSAGLLVEEVGDIVLVRTRSRSTASILVKTALKHNILAEI
jgi:hypothetical protein